MTRIEKFGQLLDWVEQGEEVIITRHGKEVARLVPVRAGFNWEEPRRRPAVSLVLDTSATLA